MNRSLVKWTYLVYVEKITFCLIVLYVACLIYSLSMSYIVLLVSVVLCCDLVLLLFVFWCMFCFFSFFIVLLHNRVHCMCFVNLVLLFGRYKDNTWQYNDSVDVVIAVSVLRRQLVAATAATYPALSAMALLTAMKIKSSLSSVLHDFHQTIAQWHHMFMLHWGVTRLRTVRIVLSLCLCWRCRY